MNGNRVVVTLGLLPIFSVFKNYLHYCIELFYNYASIYPSFSWFKKWNYILFSIVMSQVYYKIKIEVSNYLNSKTDYINITEFIQQKPFSEFCNSTLTTKQQKSAVSREINTAIMFTWPCVIYHNYTLCPHMSLWRHYPRLLLTHVTKY